MNEELSIWSLFIEASLLVQMVMFLLLIASIVSWTIIIEKWRTLKEAREDTTTFENRFWSGIDLVELYKQVSPDRENLSGVAAIFEAGFGEYARLKNQGGIEPMDIVEGAQRSMRVAMGRELDRLDSHLSFLATVGSTSPYVGLFGTVWG
ncbi:MAG TPA: protein TolQ, partial [Ectothiorhodospiraceae bacterium]|nr:protein TolQ [Ectothiorhodospiraceae bacterium]